MGDLCDCGGPAVPPPVAAEAIGARETELPAPPPGPVFPPMALAPPLAAPFLGDDEFLAAKQAFN